MFTGQGDSPGLRHHRSAPEGSGGLQPGEEERGAEPERPQRCVHVAALCYWEAHCERFLIDRHVGSTKEKKKEKKKRKKKKQLVKKEEKKQKGRNQSG